VSGLDIHSYLWQGTLVSFHNNNKKQVCIKTVQANHCICTVVFSGKNCRKKRHKTSLFIQDLGTVLIAMKLSSSDVVLAKV